VLRKLILIVPDFVLTTSNKFCDQCGAQLKATSRHCPSCGASIDAGDCSTAEERPEQTSSSPKTDSTWPCPRCGVSNVVVTGQNRFARSCRSCGDSFASGGARLGRLGQPLPRGAEPPNYRLLIIFLALVSFWFCFITLPFAFFAVCYSLQVRNKWEQGDKIEAEKASNNARIWFQIGFLISVLVILLSAFSTSYFVWYFYVF